MTTIKAEPFQFPSPVENCDCVVCTRAGVDRILYKEPQSVFELYNVESLEAGTPDQPATTLSSSIDNAEFDEFRKVYSKSVELPTTEGVNTFPWYRFCSALIKKLLKQRESRVFRSPVDYIKLGLLDYPLYVKHPMDLGTVDSRLHGNPCVYTNPDDFISDIRMVFRNAYLFNPEGNSVRTMAKILSQMFEDELASHLP